MGRRKALPLMISLLLLAGCGRSGGERTGEELAVELQREFAAMTACSCQVAMTADYETRAFDYVLDVTYDGAGAVLTIVEPAIAQGVSARIEAGRSALVYDGFSLDAGPLTADGLSPLETLPTLYRFLTRGYIAGSDWMGETLEVTYRDGESEPGVGLEAVLTFDTRSHAPLSGELFSDGQRIVQVSVKDFQSLAPGGT